jgi:hypothetical protein
LVRTSRPTAEISDEEVKGERRYQFIDVDHTICGDVEQGDDDHRGSQEDCVTDKTIEDIRGGKKTEAEINVSIKIAASKEEIEDAREFRLKMYNNKKWDKPQVE